MSEPAPAKRTPPATQVLGMLEQMQTVLTEMQAQQQGLVGAVTVLANVRDTIREAVTMMGESVKAQTAQPVLRKDDLPMPGWERWKVMGMFVTIATLSLLSGWIWKPTYPRYDGLGRALDAALVQHYSTLPKPVQEAVTRSYADQGLQGPAQRKGNGK